MKIFNTIEDLQTEFEKDSYITSIGRWQGTDDYSEYKMHVYNGIGFEAEIPQEKEDLRDITKADQPWSEMHFLERISGVPLNPGETYKLWPYAKFEDGDKFKRHNNKFSHTYMERYWPKQVNKDEWDRDRGYDHIGHRYPYGDLNDLIQILKGNYLTRQAYLPIWFPEDLMAAKLGDRVPCSLGYHFEVVFGTLNINYTIRSCDMFRHFRNDIYLTGRLLQYVANKVNIPVGKMTMIIYNLHLFENDMYAFTKKEKNL